jgi:hypothetical protein
MLSNRTVPAPEVPSFVVGVTACVPSVIVRCKTSPEVDVAGRLTATCNEA